MKAKLLFLLLLLLLLLSGCAVKADPPPPDWPERLTGEYDAALTFTFRGAEPEAVGVDSLTGRMTALFSTVSGPLARSWRRLSTAETEVLEDFLAGTGSEIGVWERDYDAPCALESYVHLGRAWFRLGAVCDGLEAEALLRLTDGAVAASAGGETALPRTGSSLLPAPGEA